MAFSVKIIGIPRDNGDPIWVIDNFFYPVDRLKGDKLFRYSVDETRYVDYVAVLNTEEALELHQKYGSESISEFDKRKEAEFLSHLKKGAPSTRWVMLEIYEWESGLDG